MNIASWRLTPDSTLPHWPQRAAAFPLQRPSCAQALRPFWPRSSLRRYGTRLYVLGDAVIPAESADLLAQIEFLHVTGEVELPDALEAAFFAIPELECGKVVHEDALPKQTRAKAKDEEPDPDTVTLSGIQLTL